MSCGCGGRAAPKVPVTSGDFEASSNGAMPRFKVVRDEIDPETQQPIVDYFTTHREARQAQVAGGGKLRIA